MNQISIERSGILSTIQDKGRFGSRLYGIGPGGPMDPFAAAVANLLVGNCDDAAYLEVHFPGPTIRFESDAVIAICGADLRPALDGNEISNWRALAVESGSILSFTGKLMGNRAYIAFYGGLEVDEWLGSHSTNLKGGFGGIGDGKPLRDGDVIALKRSAKLNRIRSSGIVSETIRPVYSQHPTVRVIVGSEFSTLDAASKRVFFNETFTLTPNSDRMGARLAGPPLKPATASMLSAGVTNGTIQLLPDGCPVVLLADHQVTGGYPRIGQIITADLGLVGQLGAGDRVSFHEVDVETAERILLKTVSDLKLLRIGCKFQAFAWKDQG